ARAGGDIRTAGPRQPLLHRHHATGAPCLLLPRQIDCVIEGCSDAESAALSRDLWSLVGECEDGVGYGIEPCDLVILDNRYTLHMRDSFPQTERRELWHTSTIGGPYLPYDT